jgi:uncharacterized protein (TIGR02569 family)
MTGDEVPDQRVLRAFGAEAQEPERLAGGRGLTWAAGAVILRPAEGADETTWKSEVLERLPTSDEFTVPRPLRTSSGTWTIDGWHALERVAGAADPTRVADVVAAGLAFQRALVALPRPAFIANSTDHWSISDRLAWQEPEAGNLPDDPLLHALVDAYEPIDSPDQVIHGDLLGNVLFAPGRPPAIIDWAPYWRPTGFGAAVAVADAACWHGFRLQELAHEFDIPSWRQLLLRALAFRITTQHLASRWTPAFAARHAPVVDAVLLLPSSSRSRR